jgi:hypothetical protein
MLFTSSSVHDATENDLKRDCFSRCQKKTAIIGSEAIDVSSDTISPGNKKPVFKMLSSLTAARMMGIIAAYGSRPVLVRSKIYHKLDRRWKCMLLLQFQTDERFRGRRKDDSISFRRNHQNGASGDSRHEIWS